MDYIPIPAKWKRYTVESYLCKPIELRCLHILFIIIITIIFTSLMIYFTSLSYTELVEIGTVNHSLYDDSFNCKSIGSVSSDQYDFVAHRLTTNSVSTHEFIQYNPAPEIDEYPYLPGLNVSNWRYQKPLEYSTDGGSMNYSVDKGNGENLQKCNSNLFQTLCNVTNINNTKYNEINIDNTNNAIKVFFWYEIHTVFNLSKYEDKLKWYYNNTPNIESGSDQFGLWYYDHITGTTHRSHELAATVVPHIPRLYETDNCIISIPQSGFSSREWYYALTNGGSLSSVWDLCKARYVDTGNQSLYMGWSLTQYYDNKTVFKIDPKEGMIECWYYDAIHGLIKTDYHNSYGQNEIIPTPSNKTGILLTVRNDLFHFSDTLTSITNGDETYVRLYGNGNDIITANDALEVWQNEICTALIAGYCDWVDVPPYFCKKYIRKTLMEAISLSLSPTSTAYSILLITFLFIMKCKSYTSKEINMDDEINLVENKFSYFSMQNENESNDLIRTVVK